MPEQTTIHLYLSPATVALLAAVSLLLILLALRAAFVQGKRRHDASRQTDWRIHDRLPLGIMVLNDGGAVVYQNRIAAGLMESASGTPLNSLLQRRAQAGRPHLDTVALPDQPQGRVSVRTIPLDERRVLFVLTDLGHQGRGEAIYRALFHQLSTPIASVFLHHDLLQEEGFDGETSARSLQYIGQGIKSLRRLLDFGRTLRDPRPEIVNPVVLAEEAVIEMEGLASQRAVSLSLQVERAGRRIAVDPELLRQVLVILLDNGVRHSPPHSTVRVVVDAPQNARITFAVSDDGPGIDPADLPYIFEPGYSGQGQTGTGLGLAIARWIVEHEAHDGQLRAANRPEGGACFTVTLPASPTVTQR